MTVPQTQTVTRLAPAVYKQLEAKLYRPVVTSNTTAHEAGYQLGVAAVLMALRNGFVVDEA